MQAVQQFCLRWNNHQPNFISVFTTLLSDEALVDVTLACEGKHLQAHRVVLSACSAYFQSLFTMNPCQHPIVILKDIKFRDLRTMVEFMYYGEVNVSQEQLPAILKIAEMLKIKGLADMQQGGSGVQRGGSSSSPPPSPAALRRKRLRKASTGSGSGSTEQTSEELPSGNAIDHLGGRMSSTEGGGLGNCGRAPSRLSLRNSTQERSTDSEPREGSQDSGPEDCSSVTRHISIESRHGSFEIRQLSHDSRQSSIHEGVRQLSHESCSRLSHESSVESGVGGGCADAADLPASPARTTTAETSSASSYPTRIGTKRGRFLMRQERIKKEADAQQETHTSPDSEPGSPGFPRSPPASLLPFKFKQTSEPAPSSNSPNLLTVPRTTSHLQPLQPLKPSHSLDEPSTTSSLVMDNVPIVRVIAESEIKQESPPPTPILPQQSHLQPLVAPSTLPPSAPMPGISPAPQPAQPPTSILPLHAHDPPTSRSGHCPVLRSGPALGCNYCWNTIDTRGRILRRKTKYHCPECQTNLCIVPCFQEYHHRPLDAPVSSQLSPSASPSNHPHAVATNTSAQSHHHGHHSPTHAHAAS